MTENDTQYQVETTYNTDTELQIYVTISEISPKQSEKFKTFYKYSQSKNKMSVDIFFLYTEVTK